MNESLKHNNSEQNQAQQLVGDWWVLGLRGLAALLFGMVALIWPGMTLLSLVYLFGAYALVNGALALTSAFGGARRHVRSGNLIFHGLVSIAAGVIAFVMPGVTALAALMLIAAWAIVSGIMEIVAAVRLRKVIRHEWLLAFAGICSVALGVLLLLQPGVGVLALIWWLGSFAILFGVLLLALAFRIRSWGGMRRTTVPTG